MIVIGIDPGKHGAIAVHYSTHESTHVTSFPEEIEDSRRHLVATLRACPQVPSIFCEHVNASPQMGVVSAFSFGRRFEMILSVCAGIGYPCKLVRPQVWQNAIGILSGGDKGRLYDLAKKLFPDNWFKRSEADALLICHYGKKVVENQI